MYQITIEGIVKAKGKILFLSNGAFQKQLIVVHTKKEKHPVYEIQSLGDMVDQTMNIKIGRKYQLLLIVTGKQIGRASCRERV